MEEIINTQSTDGKDGVGIEKIEQTVEGLYDGRPNVFTIYLTNGDKHEFKVLNGSQGVGIEKIVQTASSTASGGRNEYSIILTNGEEYPFSVYNGSGGTGSGDGASFNQVLKELNGLVMPTEKSFLYYSGTEFLWKPWSDSSSGTTTNIDLTEYQWWGRSFKDQLGSTDHTISGPMSVYGFLDGVTAIQFTDATTFKLSKKLYLDDNGDLCFDGNFYATGGITTLGSGGGTSGSSSGTSLGSLLTAINTANPTPTASGQVLYYNGSTYLWKDVSSASGGSISVSGTDLSGNASYLSGTKIRFATISGLTYPKVTADPKDTENGVLVQLPYSSSSSSSGSIQVATNPSTSSGSETWISGTKLRFVKSSGTSITVETNAVKSCVDINIPYNSSGSTTVNNSISVAGTNASGATSYISGTKIRFATASGITYPSVTTDPNDTTNGVLVQLPYSSSSSSSGTTVDLSSYLTKTDAASLYAEKSHKHSTSDISGLSSYIQGIKVSNATKADSAVKLTTTRTLWGQSFDGTANVSGDMSSVGNITFKDQNAIIQWNGSNTKIYDGFMDLYGNVPYIDFHYNKNNDVDYTARVIADGENTLSFLTNSQTGTFNLNQNKLQIGNGTLEWDSTNSCFKINGSVYATGGITTLGVSNSSTTTNNVDFTFGSITTSKTATIGTDLTVKGNFTAGKLSYDAENELLSFGSIEIDSNCIYTTKGGLNIASDTGATLTLGSGSNIQCNSGYTAILVGSDGSYLKFDAGSTTYKLNLSKAVELGVLTT